MYSINTKQNYQYFINNNKKIYHTFLDILIDFDFDLSDCENIFKKCMSMIDFDNNFFDIYGFIGLDLDSDIQLIKLKYDEFKNELVSKNKSNNVFTIFLELIGFNSINKPNINSYTNFDKRNEYIQLKIISSIEKYYQIIN